MSTGSATHPRLHTVGSGTLVVAGCAMTLMALAGGIALGLHWRGGVTPGPNQTTVAADHSGGALDDFKQRPGNSALVDRVGALAGRLIRLESEAVRLAKRMGVAPAEPVSFKTVSGTESSPANEPSGGPLLAPTDMTMETVMETAPIAPADPPDFNTSLQRLSHAMDLLEIRLAVVADASTAADLNDMAYPSRRPSPGADVTSGFGNRRDPFTGRLARHSGYDLRAPYGAPILASAGGRVRYAGYRGAYGRMVEIDHGNGLVTRYGHASKVLVKRNDIVLPGQPIALVGSTGRSTGPHVHFEVRQDGKPVSPGIYLARNGS
ncbi:MAG: M23 family metallopeptidase [Gammaproteobacteria bacterium]